MMISHITKAAAAMGTLALMSSTAYAGCNNSLYCDSNVQAYESAPAHGYSSPTLPGTYGASTSYSSPTLPGTYSSSYSSSSSYGGSISDSQADAKYGSGSISGAFVDHSSVGSAYTSGTISGMTVPGLGMNERLVQTSCGEGINVHGANGKRVLGCYKIAQPVQVQNYVRVVRPIVYVRYPVPVAVPSVCAAPVTTWGSRYGSRQNSCGW